MIVEGGLQITIGRAAAAVDRVDIRSTRPVAASNVFIGKSPPQVLEIVPMLFSVCGNAHAYAALLVCRQALGIVADPLADRARQMLVMLETLREHCWRILLDWPALAGCTADKRQLAPFMALERSVKPLLFEQGRAFRLDGAVHIDTPALNGQIDELKRLVDSAVFHGRRQSWLQLRTESQLTAWLRDNDSLPALLLDRLYRRQWSAVGRNDIELLPELDPVSLDTRLAGASGAEFARFPDWQGRCFETTVLNRQQTQPVVADCFAKYGNGLLTRLVARLTEVARIPDCLQQMLVHAVGPEAALPFETDVVPRAGGLAQVQAARGLLIHRLQLKRGLVEGYRIVAPTEWNFHPWGVLAASLRQLSAEDDTMLRQQAELLIKAIDPCVQYQLIISNEHDKITHHA